jgi:hypothetical protein
VSAVNTPTIPKYHQPLDWSGINFTVYLFASVRRGAGIPGGASYTRTREIATSN